MIFLTAQWRNLVMLNYEVDPPLLSGLLPVGTVFDRWRGMVLVTLVAFRFLNTRVLSIPFPFHGDFDEINLRFYVRRRGPDGWRRGVVFIKEVVPRALVALVARRLFQENYVRHPTVSSIELPKMGQTGIAEYRWLADHSTYSVRAEFAGAPTLPELGSECDFVTEHYWGYSGTPRGRTIEYRVDHPRWRVWPARVASFDGDAEKFYGLALGRTLLRSPRSAFVAEGSAVTVHAGQRIT